MQISRMINNFSESVFYLPNQTTVQNIREMNNSQETLGNTPKGKGGVVDRANIQMSLSSGSAERLSQNNRVRQAKDLSRTVSEVFNKEMNANHKMLFAALGTPPKDLETVKNLGNFIDRIA